MLGIFVNVVLPVFIVVALGFAIERRFRIPIVPVNQIVLYVLMPCFIFTMLLGIDIFGDDAVRIGIFIVLLTAAMLVIGVVIAALLRVDRPTTSALLLTAAFPNLGNFGLSLMLLAYGQEGVRLGAILLSAQMVFALTVAAFIASSGTANVTASLRQAAGQPALYAVAAALAFGLTGIPVPGFVLAALTLPSQAAIPMMLLVLGMQISATSGIQEPRLVSIAVVTRLVIGTLVGVGIAIAMGAGGTARNVMIVGAAMPSAIFTILTATQYDARPRFVSDVVVATTVVSIVTVTAVLAALSGQIAIP